MTEDQQLRNTALSMALGDRTVTPIGGGDRKWMTDDEVVERAEVYLAFLEGTNDVPKDALE